MLDAAAFIGDGDRAAGTQEQLSALRASTDAFFASPSSQLLADVMQAATAFTTQAEIDLGGSTKEQHVALKAALDAYLASPSDQAQEDVRLAAAALRAASASALIDTPERVTALKAAADDFRSSSSPQAQA